MKILHTSDWHLGKKLEKIPRLPEQELVLKEICEIADKENVNAVVIAGDLYDVFNPSTDAIELFYRTLKTLFSCTVLEIPHESVPESRFKVSPDLIKQVRF